MKQIISFFFIILLCTGCQEPKEVVTSKAVSNDQMGIITLQQEAPVVETTENGTTSNPVNDNSRVIVIDAGHQRYGNSDKEPIGPGASETKAKVTTGATGVSTGALESNINLEVAFKLQDKLTAAGYTVIMVRTSQDVNLSNAQRAEIANENNAAAFIRLHCNSADSSSATGTLTMAPSSSNPYCSEIAEASQSLSKSVVNNICWQTGSKNRGVTITDTMSGINWCQVPVTIVEMGFLSNVDEEQKLIDSSYQDKIAKGIVLGINEFLN
ncbi:N-acetylmuramoyl-L-alanine amidase [uncultured Thomasclavelia sp.]|uniref:N-acetylmuramoyl-L-alanine amidase n=1 Tax=uncultured Thomasclavelia sp. TaxID=3025759 RepID=UPI0025EBB8CB|nr:N-acetylmuramoyl-L-alanine amidase [uncultured Thomasclavelia sp.]